MESKLTTPRKDAIVVLGMHRSGTSAMARVLSLSGAALPEHLMGPGIANPRGHWEPADVQIFNDEIFGDLDSGWDDLFGPRRNRWGKIPGDAYVQKAEGVLERNWGDADLIVFKEPRAAILLDIWSKALKQRGFRVSYVIMVRHPLEVAASLKARDGILRNKALLLWSTYMLASEKGTRNEPRMFVTYDDLLEDAEAVLDKLETTLDLTLPGRTWSSAADIEEFLDQQERHHLSKANAEIKSFSIVDRYFKYLRDAASGAPWNVDISVEMSDWLGSLEQTVGPLVKKLERELTSARDEAQAEKGHAEASQASLAAREAELSDQMTQAHNEVQAWRARAEKAEADYLAREAELGEQLAQTQGQTQAWQARAEKAEADYAARGAELGEQLAQTQGQTQAWQARAEKAEADYLAREAELGEQLAQTQAWQARAEKAEADYAAREAELGEQLAQAQGQTQAWQARAEKAEADYLAREAELGEQLAQTQAWQARAEKAEADYAAREAELGEQLAQAQGQTQAWQARAEKAEADYLAREAELGEQLAQTQAWQARAEKAEADYAAREAELGEQLAQTQGQTQAWQARAEKAEADYLAREAELGEQLLQAQNEVQEEHARAEASAAALAAHQADLSTARGEIGRLSASDGVLRAELTDLAARQDELQRHAAELESTAAAEATARSARESELNDELGRANAASEQAQKALAEVQASAAAAAAASSQHEADLEAQLQQAESEAGLAAEAARRAAGDLEALEAQRASAETVLRDQLGELASSFEAAERRAQQLSDREAELGDQLVRAQSTTEAAVKQADALRTSLASADAEHAASEAQIRTRLADAALRAADSEDLAARARGDMAGAEARLFAQERQTQRQLQKLRRLEWADETARQRIVELEAKLAASAAIVNVAAAASPSSEPAAPVPAIVAPTALNGGASLSRSVELARALAEAVAEQRGSGQLSILSIARRTLRLDARQAAAELAQANAGRDAKHWTVAVEHYRSYLDRRPGAFAIWVQLGHCLKESGQWVPALRAYSEARRLNKADSDLELSLGHLYKLMGHREEAFAHYERSVGIDGNVHAQSELARMRMNPTG